MVSKVYLQGVDGEEERLHSLSALGMVLITINRLMAPFTPFFCEFVWTNLSKVVRSTASSVHLERLPQAEDDLIDEEVERRVQRLRDVIDLVRVIRERNRRPIKVAPFHLYAAPYSYLHYILGPIRA